MNNLLRHIEILLLEHDCVIVPEFGGFIANIVPARYIEAEGMFLPPYRTIAFNQKLSANDGLLVQSYMQAYDAAFPEAMLQLEKDITAFAYQLDTCGQIDMGSMGILYSDLNKTITLKPHESGILTPSFYGLYSLELKTIGQLIQQKDVVTTQETESIKTEDENSRKEDTLVENNDYKPNRKIKKLFDGIVDIGIAAAVAAILFFLFLPQEASQGTVNREDTCIAGSLFVQGEMPAMPKIEHKENNTPTKKTEIKEKESPKEQKPEVISKPYTIVIASCVGEKNSKAYIDNLKKNGYPDACFIKGKISRIVYGSFVTEDEAKEQLRILRSKNSVFASAWVYKI